MSANLSQLPTPPAVWLQGLHLPEPQPLICKMGIMRAEARCGGYLRMRGLSVWCVVAVQRTSVMGPTLLGAELDAINPLPRPSPPDVTPVFPRVAVT